MTVREEADRLDVAAVRRRADAGDNHDILLAPLERVDRRDLDVSINTSQCTSELGELRAVGRDDAH